MFEEIFNVIKHYDTIIIHRHNKPDGDALGSQIGLKHILKDNFPKKHIYAVGDNAGRYSFMEDSIMDEVSDDTFTNALSIILDCGAEVLVSDTRFKNASKTARIDHHTFSGTFTDVEVIDTTFESCCGEITAFAMENNLKVSTIAAKSLFTGMATDSGRFRYDSTTPRTFRQAAFLMEQGIDTDSIYADLYAEDFDSKLKRAKFTLKIKFTPKNVAYIYNTLEEVSALNMDEFSVSRGMVSTMADIKGVSIWVNFTETENGVLCELRSADRSVVHIATAHGGGGHAKACGATLSSKEEAMEMLKELDAMMED